MKKVVLAVFSTLVLSGFSQEAKTWRLGIQIGSAANGSHFSGGMSDANARFQHEAFGSGSFNLIGRYDFDRHWMVMSGFGFSSFGFQYGIAENYSLLGRARNQIRSTNVTSQFGAVEIPAMVFYKFNSNCKNTHWISGIGFAQTFVGSGTSESSVAKSSDGSSNMNYLSSKSASYQGNYWFLRWSVGRERMYKKGGILNVSLLVNVGFRNLAQSTVNYTIDNQSYTHSFTNRGNFVGLRAAYFFKPLNHPKAKIFKADIEAP